MTKRLIFIFAATSMSLTACATLSSPDKYASASCETLRTLQKSYQAEIPLRNTLATQGINNLDRVNQRDDVFRGPNNDYRRLSQTDRNDLDSVRSAYRKNGCKAG